MLPDNTPLPITFNRNDIVIIGTLTNDARTTKNRQKRTTDKVASLQNSIITQLSAHLPVNNIVFLEAPPLLSNNDDIFDYNRVTYNIALSRGARFAPTLVGEEHLWKDGFHVAYRHRHLLAKAVAAAIANVNPHLHFQFRRPPHGPFGPWISPRGCGMRPPPSLDGRLPSHRDIAVAAPFQFRRQRRQPLVHVTPLMNKNIQPLR